MKTSIYYFSGTGNSYHVARTLAMGLGNATLIPVALADKQGLKVDDAERIGFVYPSYAYGLPKIVVKVLKSLVLTNCKYTFSVVTFGTKPGATHSMIYKLLNKKHIPLKYAGDILAVENFLPIFGAQDKDKVTKLLEGVEVKTQAVLADIQAGVEMPIKTFYPLKRVINNVCTTCSPILCKAFSKKHCVGCGLCLDVCPVQNIVMKKNKIKFLNHCSLCTACIHSCPHHAIRFLRAKKGTLRYVHPSVKLRNINKQIEHY